MEGLEEKKSVNLLDSILKLLLLIFLLSELKFPSYFISLQL